MILIDAGPLIALANRNDEHHAHCRRVADQLAGERLVTTWPCFAEAMHVLYSREGYRGQAALWEYVFRDCLAIVDFPAELIRRTHELMGKYRDLPMDLADATLVALAEITPAPLVFTLDNDFALYRFRDGSAVPLA